MRIQITALIIFVAFAGITLRGNDECVPAPERTGVGQWLGKSIGRIIDISTAGIWSWVTDPRYDGLTKAQRLAAVGCFGTAIGLIASEAWKRRRIARGTYAKAVGLCAVGLLTSARPVFIGNSSI